MWFGSKIWGEKTTYLPFFGIDHRISEVSNCVARVFWSCRISATQNSSKKMTRVILGSWGPHIHNAQYERGIGGSSNPSTIHQYYHLNQSSQVRLNSNKYVKPPSRKSVLIEYWDGKSNRLEATRQMLIRHLPWKLSGGVTAPTCREPLTVKNHCWNTTESIALREMQWQE